MGHNWCLLCCSQTRACCFPAERRPGGGVGKALTSNKLPLRTIKQNLPSNFSVQLSPKEAKTGRNHSRGPAVQRWVCWLDGVGLSGSNPMSCESLQQSFAERLLLSLSIARWCFPSFIFCVLVKKMKIPSLYGTESFFFSFSSTETPRNVWPFYLLLLCLFHLAIFHLALCAVHCVS